MAGVEGREGQPIAFFFLSQLSLGRASSYQGWRLWSAVFPPIPHPWLVWIKNMEICINEGANIGQKGRCCIIKWFSSSSSQFPSLHVACCMLQWFTRIAPNLIYGASQKCQLGQCCWTNLEWGKSRIRLRRERTQKKGLSALVSLVSLLIDNFDLLAKEYLLRTPCSVLRIQRMIYP